MKKNKLPLWLIVFMMLLVVGIASFKVQIPLELMEKSNTENQQESQNVLTEITSGISKGFTNFCIITKDLIHTINGGESQFDSGINVLLGLEEINYSDISKTPADTSDSNSSIAETVSQSDKDKNVGTLTECTVVEVIDGDTFIGDFGGVQEKIRLIGIDTPESVHSDDSKNTVYGEYASQYTKGILQESDTVYLEYDESVYDKYGRTLAYVWLNENTSDISNMLNAKLLSDGYACDKVYQPNDRYADEFEQLRIFAESNDVGLWKDAGFENLWDS
ncbi:MAG: thermonuclease family protein [Lachnospiraceae bacterium]|nr:thermonuclease family protein [Lachnospiraceae bacterium]